MYCTPEWVNRKGAADDPPAPAAPMLLRKLVACRCRYCASVMTAVLSQLLIRSTFQSLLSILRHPLRWTLLFSRLGRSAAYRSFALNPCTYCIATLRQYILPTTFPVFVPTKYHPSTNVVQRLLMTTLLSSPSFYNTLPTHASHHSSRSASASDKDHPIGLVVEHGSTCLPSEQSARA